MTVHNIFNKPKQPSDLSNEPLDVNIIQGLPSEYFKDKYID